jgi:hypothetical protein
MRIEASMLCLPSCANVLLTTIDVYATLAQSLSVVRATFCAMYIPCPFVEPPYPNTLVHASRELFGAIVAELRYRPLAQAAAHRTRLRYPGHARQTAELASVLGVNTTDLMLANLSYDLFLASFACSTMALAGADGPVLARNMDWMLPDLIARASCIVALDHGLNAGFVGSVGVVSGLSRCGFAVVLNAVLGDSTDVEGYPVLFFLRHLLDDARDFGDALEIASTTRLATPALITLVGTTNRERVCVERTTRTCQQRWAEGDAPIVATNHYVRLAAPQACPRYEHLSRHAPAMEPSVTDEVLLKLLCDPNVMQSITAQHVIARPARGSLRMWAPANLHPRDDERDAVRRML